MTGQESPVNVPTGGGRWHNCWQALAVCLVLAGITFAVFGQTKGFGFVNYDDDVYVYQNAMVAGGLSLKGLIWVFTHVDCSMYHPLTMLSLMADFQLHGLEAGGYHLTNVLLHTASVILLFLILRQMTGALWRSAFVAAVFAIHPLRVESVAWVAERKDVLSAFFFMLTLGAYALYVRNPKSVVRYLNVVIAFVLALLSKPTVVTLPYVLLLLDYWPLHRFEQLRSGHAAAYFGIPRRLILEKIPLLALGLGGCATTLLVSEKLIMPGAHVSIASRIGNALVYYATYLDKMCRPEGLAVAYPYPHNGFPPWEVALAGALLAGVSVVAWRKRRTWPWLLTGWLWYLGMLMPMINFVQVGAFPIADRYTYLPQIGIYLAVTWLVAEWWPSRWFLGGLMTTVLGVLAVCAWIQTGYWEESETLWTRSLACTKGNYLAHYNLGVYLDRIGRLDEAITHYQNALQINPGDADAHYSLGVALMQTGKLDEAIAQYQSALRIKPDNAEVLNNLGSVLSREGRVDEAISQFEKALQINPEIELSHYNLAILLLQRGNVEEAKVHYLKALHVSPDLAERLYKAANDLRQKGKVDEAITKYQEAVQLKPNYAEAQVNLGGALLQTGRLDEAISHLQQALQINSAIAVAHNNLGSAFLQKGNMSEAIAHFEQASQLNPADARVKNNLAWLLATCSEASLRNGKKAVELAQQVNALARGESPTILHTLAAALAETGRFSEAVETAQRALHLAGEQSNTNLAGQLQSEMKLYQAGSPFHVPAQTH